METHALLSKQLFRSFAGISDSGTVTSKPYMMSPARNVSQDHYSVYRKPLQKSPLSIFAASTLSYTITPFAPAVSGSPMTSFRSPRSRRAFSAFNTIRKRNEVIKPMPM